MQSAYQPDAPISCWLLQISLDVVNKRTLEESLDFYCQGELMEGDNQYFCEEVGRKVCLWLLFRPCFTSKSLSQYKQALSESLSELFGDVPGPCLWSACV